MRLRRSLLISLVTFVLFTIEALFHFTIGRKGHVTIEMHRPSPGELAQILAVVLVFSMLNGWALGYILNGGQK